MGDPWVITGAGLVTAAGDTPQALFAALEAGLPLASLPPDLGFPAAAIEGFDAKRYLQRKGVRDLSRISQLACAAATGNAAGIAGVPVEEVGIVLGSAWGSLTTVVSFEREAQVQGPRFVDPILFTETVANVPAGQVAIFFGWSAFNATVSAGSASGLAGISRALDFLVEGRGTIAVAGGGGPSLNLPLLHTLHARGALARHPGSLPLSEEAGGVIGGEGACFVTLESEATARGRQASPQAWIRSRAARFTAPHPESGPAERASFGERPELLDRAELGPDDVDLVVLSANGTRAGDLAEGGAVIDTFGDLTDGPLVVAPKGVLGETWGASGAIAIVVAIEAMRTQRVPGAPRGYVAARGLERLRLPKASCAYRVRNAIVVDRTDAGHQLGIVLSAAGARDERA